MSNGKALRDAVWSACLEGEAEVQQALLVWADWLQDHVDTDDRRLGGMIYQALTSRPEPSPAGRLAGSPSGEVRLMAQRVLPGSSDIRLVITTHAPLMPENRKMLKGKPSDHGPGWILRRTGAGPLQLYIRLLVV